MIYLFNSGFYPLHRVNLLNTMFLPSGIDNEYRYSKDNLDPGLFANPHLVKKHDDCVVIFVDRHAARGYEYAPIRRARLLQLEADADHLFFRIVLLDYVFPLDVPAFNEDILESLKMHGLPQLTSGSVTETKDGRYAILADSFCAGKDTLYAGDQAWVKAVDYLAGRQAFADPAVAPIFVKCSVLSKERTVNPGRIFNPQRFRFVPGREYSLKCTYRYPRQKGQTDGGTLIPLSSTDNLKWADDRLLFVDSFMNTVTSRFTPKRYAEDLTGYLALGPADEGFLVPRANVGFVLRESIAAWGVIVAALFAFSIASVLIGIDMSKLNPPYLSNLLTNHWIKLIGAALQTFALFVLFRLIGKKPV